MKRIFIGVIFLFPFSVWAQITEHDAGYYITQTDAQNACYGQSGTSAECDSPAGADTEVGWYMYREYGQGTEDRYKFYWYKSGECPEGQIADPSTGQCVYDCSDKIDTFAGWQRKYSVCVVLSDGSTNCDAACKESCATQWEGTQQYDLETDTLWGVITYTGAACPSSSGSSDPNSPEQTNDIGDADQSSNEPPDTDGDGTPDSNDSDIDGDGTLNSQDSDIDGDGIANEDDPTPNGEGTGDGQAQDGSQAYHSDDCNVRPSCDGDPIQCAQLYEIWRWRCQTSLTEELDGTEEGTIQGDADADVTQTLDTLETDWTAALDDHGQWEFTDVFDTPLESVVADRGCQDYTFNFGFLVSGGTYTLTCAQSAPVRDVMAYVFGFATLIGIYLTAFRAGDK